MTEQDIETIAKIRADHGDAIANEVAAALEDHASRERVRGIDLGVRGGTLNALDF